MVQLSDQGKISPVCSNLWKALLLAKGEKKESQKQRREEEGEGGKNIFPRPGQDDDTVPHAPRGTFHPALSLSLSPSLTLLTKKKKRRKMKW